jgi:glycosyltransferase involved in cell wall biosynthesis
MDKPLNPEISIIMPVYNGMPHLPAAIKSLLHQTYRNFELIIINDGSTDNSLDTIRSFSDGRIHIIDNPKNLHLIASLNIGLEAARGPYIARMDQDDISMPDRLQKEFDFLETHPEVVIVGTWSKLIDSEGKEIGIHKNPLRNNLIKYDLLFGNTVTHPSVMMRRKEIMEIGGYDPAWVNTEDYNLYSRVIKKYCIANIGEPLLHYRVHGASLTGLADSQAIIHENTKKMIYENISYYFPLSEEERRLVNEMIVARNPNPNAKLKDVLRARKLHAKIYHAFLAKENSSLDEEDRQELGARYAARNKLMSTKYLVGKYHKLFKHA